MDSRVRIIVVSVILLSVLLVCFDPTYSQSGIDSGLVACWEMDEPSGPRADSVSYAHLTDNNTVNSITGLLSVSGNYISANSEYLSIKTTAAPLLNPGTNGSYTIASWVYLKNTFTTGRSPVFGKFNSISAIDFAVYPNASLGTWVFVSYDTTPTPHSIYGDNYNLDVWELVVAYYDNSAQVIGFSTNGQAATTLSHTSQRNSGTDIWIGRDTGTYAEAYIDTTAYWNRVLSAAEITELYNSGLGMSCDDIVEGNNGGGTVAGPLGSTYDVDLPSGGTGVIEMYSTAGELGTMAGLAVLITITMFRVIQATVTKGRAK